MQHWWEQFSGWLVAALLALSTAFLGFLNRRHKDDLQECRIEVAGSSAQLHEHEIKHEVTREQIGAIRDDVREIKTAINTVNTRITEHQRDLHTKLDRLLQRGKD